MNALLAYIVLYAFFCFVFLSTSQVERGSPKSCFLFLGYVLCEINWVSVLSDAWSPNPHPQTHNMIVCLLYMMVLLAKEEQLIGKEVLFEKVYSYLSLKRDSPLVTRKQAVTSSSLAGLWALKCFIKCHEQHACCSTNKILLRGVLCELCEKGSTAVCFVKLL